MDNMLAVAVVALPFVVAFLPVLGDRRTMAGIRAHDPVELVGLAVIGPMAKRLRIVPSDYR